MTESQKGTAISIAIIGGILLLLSWLYVYMFRYANDTPAFYIDQYRDCVTHADAEWCYKSLTEIYEMLRHHHDRQRQVGVGRG